MGVHISQGRLTQGIPVPDQSALKGKKGKRGGFQQKIYREYLR